MMFFPPATGRVIALLGCSFRVNGRRSARLFDHLRDEGIGLLFDIIPEQTGATAGMHRIRPQRDFYGLQGIDADRHRDPYPQGMRLQVGVIDGHQHRHPLHHLDPVAAGV